MYAYNFYTNVENERDAVALLQMISSFFVNAKMRFDLHHSKKVLTINSVEDENHNDIVEFILNKCGFTCKVVD